MKVKLNCRYGKNLPNDIIDIKSVKVAKEMIESGNAFDASDLAVTKDSKEVASLKTRVVALEEQVSTLSADKKALEEQVSTLSADKKGK